jgi:hypothetical protein
MKVVRYLSLAFVILASAFPYIANAQMRGFDIRDLLPGINTPFPASEGLLGVVGTAITLAFGIAGLVAVIYLIMGGFSYVTAGGNPEAVEAAKTTIVNAIIGLVIILVSYLIVQFIMDQLGAQTELPDESF